MARRKLVAGNWKMHGLAADLGEVTAVSMAAETAGADVALCLPATLIERAVRAAPGFAIGGQDVHQAGQGAHTGCVSAATKSEAEDKWAAIKKLPLEIDALSLLSEALNFDFAKKQMDEPFTEAELSQMSGLQGIRDRVTSVKKNPTVREFIDISGRGRVHNPIVGGPKDVADQLEAWFAAPACDGFVLSATHVPGAYEDFVRFVIPELQRRGLFRKEFAGTTLRDNLGLVRPAVGAWRGRESV